MIRSRSAWLETAADGGEAAGRSLDRRIRRPALAGGGDGSAMVRWAVGGRACRLGGDLPSTSYRRFDAVPKLGKVEASTRCRPAGGRPRCGEEQRHRAVRGRAARKEGPEEMRGRGRGRRSVMGQGRWAAHPACHIHVLRPTTASKPQAVTIN